MFGLKELLNVTKDRIVSENRVTRISNRASFLLLQLKVGIFTPNGRFNILTQKYEFGYDDFIAYVGGYLVSITPCRIAQTIC